MRGRRLGNYVLAQIKLLARRRAVRPGGYGVDHRAGRCAHAAVGSEYVLGGCNRERGAREPAGFIYRGVQPVRLGHRCEDLAGLGYAYNAHLRGVVLDDGDDVLAVVHRERCRRGVENVAVAGGDLDKLVLAVRQLLRQHERAGVIGVEGGYTRRRGVVHGLSDQFSG